MFPDLNDVKRIVNNQSLLTRPEDIWQDVVLVHGFLIQSRGYCRNKGRLGFDLVSELKQIAESFIGRPTSDDALKVAMKLLGLEVKSSKKDGQDLVKLPPLVRFEERREAWKQHQGDLETQIAIELQRMAEMSAVQAKQS